MPANDTRPSPHAWLLPWLTLGLVLGVVLGLGAHAWPLPAAALTLSLAAAFLYPGRRRVVALVFACAALGSLLTIRANHPALPPEGEYVISGVVLDEIVLDADGHLRAPLGSVTLNGTPAADKAWWTAYTDPEQPLPDWLTPGTHIVFTGEAYHPQGASNPGGYNFRLDLLADGITLGVYGCEDWQPGGGSPGLAGAMAALRHRLTMALMRVMGQEAGSLAAAMLLGTKHYLPNEDYYAFKALGILHILSVSGFHVGVLALMLNALLRRVPRVARLFVLGALLAFYALLTGGAAPVIRASLLLLLRESGHLQHRRNAPLHLLCLSAVCQLIFNPIQFFGASFQLTYSAMLGLILIYPRLQRAFASPSRPVTFLWRGLMASVSVQTGMLPVLMTFFGGFPPVSLVINVFVVSGAGFLIGLYWIMLVLLPVPLLREGFGAAVGWLTRGLLAVIRFLAGVLGKFLALPVADVFTIIGWVMVIVGLSLLLPRSRVMWRRILSLCGACLIVLSCVRLPNTGAYWLQFSDGEADAALLHDHNTVVLVDVGENPGTVATYLRQRCLAVDLLILTHLHTDHAGGLLGLVNAEIPVRVCALPEGAFLAGDVDDELFPLLQELADSGTQFVTLSRGDVIDLPSGTLTVLWPQKGAVRPGMDANHTCLALRADILGTSMLLASDLTSRYEMYAAGPADILKAAHHGSSESTSPDFLGAVSPQAILLSCGTDEREAAFLPRAGDIPVYSTHASGAVTIRFTENAFTVETFLPR